MNPPKTVFFGIIVAVLVTGIMIGGTSQKTSAVNDITIPDWDSESIPQPCPHAQTTNKGRDHRGLAFFTGSTNCNLPSPYAGPASGSWGWSPTSTGGVGTVSWVDSGLSSIGLVSTGTSRPE